MMISRIISLLKKNKQGISYSKIAAKLFLSPKEKRALTTNLQKLQAQGVIRLIRKQYFFSLENNIFSTQDPILFGGHSSQASRDLGLSDPMKS